MVPILWILGSKSVRLELRCTATTSESGSSRTSAFTFCSLLLSYSSKSCSCSPLTKSPLRSRTVVGAITTVVVVLIVTSPRSLA